MDFAALKTEVKARGFDHLSDTRAGQFVNWGRAELDQLYLWPYLEKSGEGTAPLTVSDLHVIEAVTNETRDYPLMPRDYRTLLEEYGDLTTSGLPEWYYVAWPSGSPVVATYPRNSDTIGVQYYKVTTDLTGTDTPAAPTRFHEIIVDLAVRRAYLDSDNFQAAQMIQAEVDRKVGVMVDALLGGQTVQGPAVHQQLLGASEDW